MKTTLWWWRSLSQTIWKCRNWLNFAVGISGILQLPRRDRGWPKVDLNNTQSLLEKSDDNLGVNVDLNNCATNDNFHPPECPTVLCPWFPPGLSHYPSILPLPHNHYHDDHPQLSPHTTPLLLSYTRDAKECWKSAFCPLLLSSHTIRGKQHFLYHHRLYHIHHSSPLSSSFRLSFPFLSSLRCANTIIEQHGKDVFRWSPMSQSIVTNFTIVIDITIVINIIPTIFVLPIC